MNARLSTLITIITRMSALSEVENGLIWYQNVYSHSHDLPGVAAGLVHHAPLVAEQVVLLRRASEQPAVGHEQQRLGVVGLVELVARQQAPSSPPLCARRAASPSSPAPGRSRLPATVQRAVGAAVALSSAFAYASVHAFCCLARAPPCRWRSRACSGGSLGMLRSGAITKSSAVLIGWLTPSHFCG